MPPARLLLCAPLLCACSPDSVEEEEEDTDPVADAFPLPGNQPVDDAWTLEIDQPFDAAAVQTLIIGGTEHAGNFANRGNITVRYAATDRITVEMRRFTSASNPPGAQEDFDRLSLWAYETVGNPSPPSQLDAADGCIDLSGQA